MAAMRCMVTGGAGFIASHLVDLLLTEGHRVDVIDDLSTGRRENLNSEAHFHEVSILDPDRIRPLFAGCDWVFHAAAWPRIQPSFDDPLAHEAINVAGTINCLIAARAGGAGRFIYFGSSAVYGTPDEIPTPETAAIRCDNPYALHKFAGEQYSLILGKRWSLPVVSLRIFNVFGPRSYNIGRPHSAYSPVIGIFDHQRKRGRPLTITGDGKQSRDFVHVHDVARAFMMAARSEVTGEVLNAGSGETVSINAIAAMISDRHEFIPGRPSEAAVTHADISKIQRMLDWSPTISLADGLAILDE